MSPVKPLNLLILMTDQQARNAVGYQTGGLVKTPNLDTLAARGLVFSNCYCNSPLCVPSRASIATGRYIHEIESWDNAFPYRGNPESWGHRLIQNGLRCATVGKLHFRTSADDTGFPEQYMPMHVSQGVGDLYSLVRSGMIPRAESRAEVEDAHIGASDYTQYDKRVASRATTWLKTEGVAAAQPWALVVSFVSPHYPLVAPSTFAEFYDEADLNAPAPPASADEHPVLMEMKRVLGFDPPLDALSVSRARRMYYALCSFVDDQIGKVIRALYDTGLDSSTRILYFSDHGENAGDHGFWWKHTMHEGSVGVPLILAGPEITPGVRDDPVSLVDIFPTIIDAVGAPHATEDAALAGVSLLRPFGEPQRKPYVFSEYHGEAAPTGIFMLRKGAYKLIEYVGYRSQLFDLERDPGEGLDLIEDSEYEMVARECTELLHKICDPAKVSKDAFEAQGKKLTEYGGAASVLERGYEVPFTPVPRS